MRIIYGALLGTVLIAIFLTYYRRNKDLFAPMCIFSAYQFIRYVPNMMIETSEYSYLLNDENTFITLIIELVFVVSVYTGYSLLSRNKDGNEINMTPQVKEISLLQIYAIFFIGAFAKIYTIIDSGGIRNILSNTGNAYLELSTGNGYINSLMYFVYISFYMMLERIRLHHKTSDKIALFVMASLYMLSDLIYSHRSTTVTIIIIIIFGINYLYKKIRIRDFLKPRLVIIFLFCAAVISLMPLLRTSSFTNFSLGTENLNLSSSLNSIIDRISMVGRDTFVYNYFNFDNFWYGKSFLNLIAAPIPSSIWGAKPAVDDGMYLVHLIKGIPIEPNTSVNDMILKYSIPFTSQGLLYANFGVIGVIIGGLITGRLYHRFYVKLQQNQNVYNIALYRIIVMDFGFTVSLLVDLIMQTICIKLVYIINKRKYEKQIVQGKEEI